MVDWSPCAGLSLGAQLVADYDRHLLESDGGDVDGGNNNGNEGLTPENEEEIKR